VHGHPIESVDAAVLSAALINKCPPKPRPKHYTDAVWEPTGIVVSRSIVNSAVKKLSADLAFMSAINAELSRLTQQRSTASAISSSDVMVLHFGSMLSSKCTKRLMGDDHGDLSLEYAHMDPCVIPPTQEATNVNSALDAGSPRPERAMSQVRDVHIGNC